MRMNDQMLVLSAAVVFVAGACAIGCSGHVKIESKPTGEVSRDTSQEEGHFTVELYCKNCEDLHDVAFPLGVVVRGSRVTCPHCQVSGVVNTGTLQSFIDPASEVEP